MTLAYYVVYCDPLSYREELRSKFVKAETTLFKCRWRAASQQERTAFLNARNFGGDLVLEEDKKMYMKQLMAATPSIKSETDFGAESFYKVCIFHFESTIHDWK